MEQTKNLRLVVGRNEEIDPPTPWRSFGGIASTLVARAESRRAEAPMAEDNRFVPVAWAAE